MTSRLQNWCDFLSEKTKSKNWVVFARRTPRLVQKYGDDVVVLTPKRYRALREEWKTANPDAHE